MTNWRTSICLSSALSWDFNFSLLIRLCSTLSGAQAVGLGLAPLQLIRQSQDATFYVADIRRRFCRK